MASFEYIFYQDKKGKYWLTKTNITFAQNENPTGERIILTLPKLVDATGGTVNYNIHECAFYGNDSIGELRIPSTISEVRSNAFKRSNIHTIYFLSEFPPTVYTDTFADLNVYNNASLSSVEKQQLIINCCKYLSEYYIPAFQGIPQFNPADPDHSQIVLIETNEVIASDTEFPALYLAGEQLERITFNAEVEYIGKMPALAAVVSVTKPDKNPNMVSVSVGDSEDGGSTLDGTSDGITANDNYKMTSTGKNYGASLGPNGYDPVTEDLESHIISLRDDGNKGLLGLMPGSEMYFTNNANRRCDNMGNSNVFGQYIKITEHINENAFFNQVLPATKSKPNLYIEAPTISPLAFQNAKIQNLVLNMNSIQAMAKNSFIKANIDSISLIAKDVSRAIVLDGNTNPLEWKMTDDNSILYCIDTIDQLDQIYICWTKQTAAQIPTSLNNIVINDYAFYNNSDLVEFTCTEKIKKIKRHAFANCSCLTKITFSTSLFSKHPKEVIEPRAFVDCPYLILTNCTEWQQNLINIKKGQLISQYQIDHQGETYTVDFIETQIDGELQKYNQEIKEYFQSCFINCGTATQIIITAANAQFASDYLAQLSVSHIIIEQTGSSCNITDVGHKIEINHNKILELNFIPNEAYNTFKINLPNIELKNNASLTIRAKDVSSLFGPQKAFSGHLGLSGRGVVYLENIQLTGDRLSQKAPGITIKTGSTIQIGIIGEHNFIRGGAGYDGIRVEPSSQLSIFGTDKDTSCLYVEGSGGYETFALRTRVDNDDSTPQDLYNSRSILCLSEVPSVDWTYTNSLGGSGIGYAHHDVGAITIKNLNTLSACGFGPHAAGIGGGLDAKVAISNIGTLYTQGGYVGKKWRYVDSPYASLDNTGVLIGLITSESTPAHLVDASTNSTALDGYQPYNYVYYPGGLLVLPPDKYGKKEPEGGPGIATGVLLDWNKIPTGNIYLSNINQIISYGGSKSAGIGAYYWTTTNIVIENCAQVIATGGCTAAGIGLSRGGDNDSTKTNQIASIIFRGTNDVYAVGGCYGAGIGGGYNSNIASRLEFTVVNTLDTTFHCYGGPGAAGIGSGYNHADLGGTVYLNKNSVCKAGSFVYSSSSYIRTIPQDIGLGVCYASKGLLEHGYLEADDDYRSEAAMHGRSKLDFNFQCYRNIGDTGSLVNAWTYPAQFIEGV